jgi:hypothetical protein
MNNMNRNDFVYEPYEFTDAVTAQPDTSYSGISGQGNANVPEWRIKKVTTTGGVTTIEYPNGDQSFSFKWSLRASYSYE